MTAARTVAGRYRLEGEIGRGATGTVFQAYDEVLRRRVAIKEVRFPSGMPRAEADQLAERTLHEARAIAALAHPHVITLYDIVLLDAGPVIVMELMAAQSLAEIMAHSGPLSDSDAAIVGEAVASGVMAAHKAGITHRDIKPANVLIGADGRMKLTDFGIARSVREESLTATGLLMGSPAYISPEVASGRPAGPSADAWGLGALLFAAVEGHPPFDKGNAIATVTAVVHDPVPAHPHSGTLASLIDALLAKSPDQRMSVGEAHELLAGIADGATFTVDVSAGAHLPAPSPTATVADAATAPRDAAASATWPRTTTARASSWSPTAVAGGSSSSPELPPPPWAAADAARLTPLPTTPNARPRIRAMLGAIAVGILAAAVGFTEVLVIANWG